MLSAGQLTPLGGCLLTQSPNYRIAGTCVFLVLGPWEDANALPPLRQRRSAIPGESGESMMVSGGYLPTLEGREVGT